MSKFDKLSDIAEVIDSLHKTPKYSDEGQAMVRCTDVKYGKLDLTNTIKVNEEVFTEFSRRYTPSKEDIIITRVGSYGITAIVDELDFCLGQNTSVIVPKNINARYLYLALNSPYVKNQIEFSVVGSTQKTLSLKAINNLDIPRFDPDIEDKIAKIGGELDDKIELNRQTNQTLEHIAQAIFKSWFVDFEPTRAKAIIKAKGGNKLAIELAAQAIICGAMTLEEIEQLDSEYLQFEDLIHPKITEKHPNPQGLDYWQPQQLKTTAALFPDTLDNSALGEVPEGWSVKQLDEIAENHSTTFDFSQVEEVVFVNTGDVLEGRFLHKNYSSKEGLPGQAKKIIKKDDILYSEIRPKNKRYAYVAEECDDYVVSTKFMIIRSLGFVHPRYLYQILRQQKTVDEFNLIAESRSGTFPQITFDSIGYLPIVVPTEGIQEAFMTFFSPIIGKIDLVIKEEKTLAELRDSLLPKLLSGEIDNKQEAA